MLITGRCHCGNISFTFTREPDPTEISARACSCSFCTKHGGVWTSCPSGSLKVSVKDPARVICANLSGVSHPLLIPIARHCAINWLTRSGRVCSGRRRGRSCITVRQAAQRSRFQYTPPLMAITSSSHSNFHTRHGRGAGIGHGGSFGFVRAPFPFALPGAFGDALELFDEVHVVPRRWERRLWAGPRTERSTFYRASGQKISLHKLRHTGICLGYV